MEFLRQITYDVHAVLLQDPEVRLGISFMPQTQEPEKAPAWNQEAPEQDPLRFIEGLEERRVGVLQGADRSAKADLPDGILRKLRNIPRAKRE